MANTEKTDPKYKILNALVIEEQSKKLMPMTAEESNVIIRYREMIFAAMEEYANIDKLTIKDLTNRLTMDKIKRHMRFSDGIIAGDVIRDIISIFPSLKDCFSQRKPYDEYYYTETAVSLNLDQIERLNDEGYIFTLDRIHILIQL